MKQVKYAVLGVLAGAAVVGVVILVGLVILVHAARDWLGDDHAE